MDIGAKLREIRESRGLTGEALCTLLGKSGNSYISKIESGFKKDLNLGELKEICNALEVSPSVFLEQPEIKRKTFFDNAVFRDEAQISSKVKDKIKVMLPKISKTYAVKRSLGELPCTVDQIKLGFRANNENSAKELAQLVRGKFDLGRWGLDIFSVVRNNFNIYVMGEDLESIWGIYSCDSKGNPVILYNHNQPNQQRNVFTLAHELGHHLISEGETEVDFENKTPSSSEFLADVFASELLMPEVSVGEVFKKHCATDEDKITSSQLIELTEVFKVSYGAINRRLKDLGFITEKTWNRLKEPVLKNPKYTPETFFSAIPIVEQLRRDLESAVQKGKIGTVRAESILGEELRA